MSLIDPSTRWWNRNGSRRVTAGLCWVMAVALSAVSGWAITAEMTPADVDTSPPWLIPVASTVALLLLLAGIFLWIASADSDVFDPRVIFMPVAATFTAQGLGEVVHALIKGARPQTVSIVFVAVGAVALVATQWVTGRLTANRTLQAKVERDGVVTTGRVTRTLRYFLDYTPVTRVTVEFTDTEGRKRWIGKTVAGRLHKGSPVTVRYLPNELGRKAAAVVSTR